MTYKEALKASKGKVSTSDGLAHLANTVYCVTFLHRGLSASMLFEAAKARGLTGSQLNKMSPAQLSELHFSQLEG